MRIEIRQLLHFEEGRGRGGRTAEGNKERDKGRGQMAGRSRDSRDGQSEEEDGSDEEGEEGSSDVEDDSEDSDVDQILGKGIGQRVQGIGSIKLGGNTIGGFKSSSAGNKANVVNKPESQQEKILGTSVPWILYLSCSSELVLYSFQKHKEVLLYSHHSRITQASCVRARYREHIFHIVLLSGDACVAVLEFSSQSNKLNDAFWIQENDCGIVKSQLAMMTGARMFGHQSIPNANQHLVIKFGAHLQLYRLDKLKVAENKTNQQPHEAAQPAPHGFKKLSRTLLLKKHPSSTSSYLYMIPSQPPIKIGIESFKAIPDTTMSIIGQSLILLTPSTILVYALSNGGRQVLTLQIKNMSPSFCRIGLCTYSSDKTKKRDALDQLYIDSLSHGYPSVSVITNRVRILQRRVDTAFQKHREFSLFCPLTSGNCDILLSY